MDDLLQMGVRGVFVSWRVCVRAPLNCVIGSWFNMYETIMVECNQLGFFCAYLMWWGAAMLMYQTMAACVFLL